MSRFAALAALLPLLTCLGCGGGSGKVGEGPAAPLPPLQVTAIYPSLGDLDLTTLVHAQAISNGLLDPAAGPSGPGAVAIHFRPQLSLDFDGLFVGSDPVLGLDVTKILLGRWEPGLGVVLVPLASVDRVQVGADDIVRLTPAELLGEGQYIVSVNPGVEDLAGRPLQGAAYQTFWIRRIESVPPVVRQTLPTGGVAAGAASATLEIVCSEPIAATSISASTVYVHDVTGGGSVLLTPAPGYPQLKSAADAAVWPSNGHVIVWRGAANLPFGATLRLTVEGEDAPPAGSPPDPDWIEDINGNALAETLVRDYQTAAGP
jgi:hypothetical protein